MKTNTNLYHKNYQLNIAGRLPEHSRNRFVDLQSQKTVNRPKTKSSLNIPGRLPENSRRWFQKSLIGIERIEDIEKKRIFTKKIFKSDLFWD